MLTHIMKKPARLLLTLAGLLVLLLAASPLAGVYLLRRYVDKEFLVLQTEAKLNVRASLDEVNLTLFTWPPSLRLSGIKLAPRDAYSGTPLAQRPPLVEAPVQIEMAYAELLPDELWKRNFIPKVIRFIGVDVKEHVNPRDGSSLEKLFLPPPPAGSVAQADVPRAIPYQPGQPLPSTATPEPAPVVTNGSASLPEAPVGTGGSKADARLALEEISIEQGHFHITNETTDSRFEGDLTDFFLSITNIDIDPTDIQRHNNISVSFRSQVVLDGQAQLGGRMQDVRFAQMSLKGEGQVNPVDPRTMTWSPAALMKMAVASGSTVGGHMTIGDAAADNLDKLLKYGVDLRGIRIGGPLQQDLNLNLLLKDETITFQEDAQLALPDYEVRIKRDSWMNFAKDNQGLLTRLYCGPALKEQIVRGVSARGLGDNISRMVVDAVSDKDGRISFDLSITGPFSHPQVKPDIQLRLENLLGDDIERKAKKLLENENVGGLLKGLFKKL